MSSYRRNSVGRAPSTKGKDSARSATSQSSSVAELLTVSPVKQQHTRGNGLRSTSLNLSGNTRKVRPKSSVKPESYKSKTSPRTRQTSNAKKPAWAIKQSIEDETPRGHNIPLRPSIQDFIGEDGGPVGMATDSLDDLCHQDSQLNADKSLLDLLSADTDRSEFSPRVDKSSQGSEKNDSDFQIRHRTSKGTESENETDNFFAQNPPFSTLKHSKRNVLLNSQNLTSKTDSKRKQKNASGSKSLHDSGSSASKKGDSQSRRNDEKKKSKESSSNSIDALLSDTESFTMEQFNIDSINQIKPKEKKNKNNSKDHVYDETTKRSAAFVIQTWWRRTRIRRTAGAAAMRRMMQSKQMEMRERLQKQKELEYEKHTDEFEQLKFKEEQARAVRQQIISEIHNKGEFTKKKNQSLNGSKQGKPTTKIKYMLPNGKVTSERTTKKAKGRRERKSSINRSSITPLEEKELKRDEKEKQRPTTSSSVGRCIDEIFESSCKNSSSENTPRSNEKSQHLDNLHDDSSTFILESVTSTKKSTYTDLMNTLKELEDEELKPMKTSSLFTYSKRSPINVNNDTHTPAHASTLLSADKLQSIMSFLDEVERTEDDVRSEVTKVSQSIASSSHFTFTTEDDSRSTIVKEGNDPLDSASQLASDITNAIDAQRVEMDEKQRTLDMMKKAMNQQKDFTTMQIKEMDKEHKKQLHIQREDYESTIKRHLSFIDQLIDDKKVLTKRCEDLVTKLKDIDQNYSSKFKQLTENHTIDMKKQKDIMEAAEKIRREKWIKEKTQEIKEITVKGLEPDIQKLIAKHKAEIKKIKAMKQGEILEADERVGRKYIQQLEELRSQMEREKEMALRKERENARQRVEDQVREEEESFQQQRRRLQREIDDEKQRLSEQAQQMKSEFEEKKSAYEITLRQTLTHATEDFQKQLEDLKQKHESEMKKLKDQLDIEREQWIENYMKKQETQLLAKERELKETVREGRDKEIEMVIARLERETAQGREESERTAENRIKRIRDKYENEIKELEYSERSIQEKCNTLKQRVDEMENECIRLRSDRKSKEQELLDNQKITTRLQEERGKVTDIVRQEFADRLVALEEESKRLRNELSEEKARHKFNIERITNDKDEELEEVHKRVKKAIAKKEETTTLLREQMLAAEKRAEHLEQLLADQRKKILGK